MKNRIFDIASDSLAFVIKTIFDVKNIRRQAVPCVAAMVVALLSWSGTEAVHAQASGPLPSLTPENRLALDIFRELVEINTTHANGSTKAAQAVARRLSAAGFAANDIQLVGPHPENLNVIVRFHGKSTLRPILLLGHLDVVEALASDWTVDPFHFLEKDGFFYGRGTIDMKADDAALLAAILRLKAEGFTPERDMILALTEDEEVGGANGVDWLLSNRRELIDAEYCINPDGGGGEIQDGAHTMMEIQTSEKLYADFMLEVKNKGGHSSRPVKENAITRLAEALTRIGRYDFPIHLNETTRMFFERSAGKENGQTKTDMMAVAHGRADSAAAERLAASSAFYNAELRTTCVATLVNAGHAANALPQSAKATLNCRMLPDDTQESVLALLRSVIADTQVAVTIVTPSTPAPLSPLRADLLEVTERLTHAIWPAVVVTPIMSTGASDGKALRAAGIPVYGISGMFSDRDDNRAHGRDERLGVKDFYDGVAFTYNFVKTLASSRPELPVHTR